MYLYYMWAAIKTIGVTFGMRNQSINKVHGQGFYLSQLLDPPSEQISRYSGLQQEHTFFKSKSPVLRISDQHCYEYRRVYLNQTEHVQIHSYSAKTT
jgi:hypothetical protein